MTTLQIQINYKCPLDCRYCSQREKPEIFDKYFTAEEMIEAVQEFLDFTGTREVCIDIAGGEPLLKFKDIQTLIRTFPDLNYEITTNGLFLTQEKTQFFSRYNVSYTLSVDGGEKVTNYLRPFSNGKTGYFNVLKKNIPNILYYAPDTSAKIIVPRRLISELYNSYLELEKLGFNHIFITPNVYENTVDNNNPELSTGEWNESDWIEYENQINQITKEIQTGIQLNKKRCLITNIEMPITKMLFPDTNNSLSFNKLICPVLDYKGGKSPTGGEGLEQLPLVSLCIENVHSSIKTQKDLLEKVINDYELIKDKCPINNDCSYWPSCMYSICFAENLKNDICNNIWHPTQFQCNLQQIYHSAACKILSTLMENENDVTKYYFQQIFHKKEVILNGTIPLLPKFINRM